MDSIISGLNKVVCRSESNGSTVSITNGTNTWTSEIVAGVASFMIPSVPAPAKTTYTITLGTYTRQIELGFGDSLDLTLDADHEPVDSGDINDLQDQIDDINDTRLTNAEVLAVRTLLNKLSGKNLVSASASGTTLYLTSIV